MLARDERAKEKWIEKVKRGTRGERMGEEIKYKDYY